MRALERARVAIGGAREHHDGVAGADADAGDVGRATRHPELALERALEPQHLLDERRDEAAVVAEPLLQVRPLAEHLQRERRACGPSSPARR